MRLRSLQHSVYENRKQLLVFTVDVHRQAGEHMHEDEGKDEIDA